jgi:phosphonate transport system substrate-binding protein
LKFLALALACLSFATACTKPEKGDAITIGFNPAENADVVETNGKAFSEYYQKQTGVAVKTFIATDYTALIEAMRAGRVDFAFLPAFSYVKAEEIAGAKVLMKAVRKGRPVLYSALIVREGSGIKSVADLKGKNVAWVDPASASGFIIPRATLLRKEKIEADSYFGKQVYAGSHDALVLAVLNGTVDAGATFSNDPEGKDGSWHQYLKSPADQRKIKMIYISDPIPGDTLATTAAFEAKHAGLVGKTVKMLGEMANNEEGKKLLAALYHIDAMVPAAPAEYDGVREAAKTVGVK